MTKFRRIARRTKRFLLGDPDAFLKGTRGVIHVGANSGPEREIYEDYKLPVVWIEPIPDVFEKLCQNLRHLKRQRAFKYLITDQDNVEYPFHVSNNDGASSSILDLKDHRDIWPDVKYTHTITLCSATLPTMLRKEQIDPAKFDVLVMDTQGSELLVLRGAEPVLSNFAFIKIEVPDFEAYEGCCQAHEVDAFLTQRGFAELSRTKFASHAEGGSYYDIIYSRKNLTSRA